MLRRQISKRLLQQNKARQILQKTLFPPSFPSPRDTYWGRGGVINVIFREIWRALFSCNYCFEIRSLVLLPTSL